MITIGGKVRILHDGRFTDEVFEVSSLVGQRNMARVKIAPGKAIVKDFEDLELVEE